MDQPAPVTCQSLALGLTIADDEVKLFISVGEELGEQTHAIVMDMERFHAVLHSMGALLYEANSITQELDQFIGEARTKRMHEIVARYNAQSN